MKTKANVNAVIESRIIALIAKSKSTGIVMRLYDVQVPIYVML